MNQAAYDRWIKFVADLDRREPKTDKVERAIMKPPERYYERRVGLMVCRYCSNPFSSNNRPLQCPSFTGPCLGITETLP